MEYLPLPPFLSPSFPPLILSKMILPLARPLALSDRSARMLPSGPAVTQYCSIIIRRMRREGARRGEREREGERRSKETRRGEGERRGEKARRSEGERRGERERAGEIE